MCYWWQHLKQSRMQVKCFVKVCKPFCAVYHMSVKYSILCSYSVNKEKNLITFMNRFCSLFIKYAKTEHNNLDDSVPSTIRFAHFLWT